MTHYDYLVPQRKDAKHMRVAFGICVASAVLVVWTLYHVVSYFIGR